MNISDRICPHKKTFFCLFFRAQLVFRARLVQSDRQWVSRSCLVTFSHHICKPQKIGNLKHFSIICDIKLITHEEHFTNNLLDEAPTHYRIKLKQWEGKQLCFSNAFITHPTCCEIRGTKPTISFCEGKTWASESLFIRNPVRLWTSRQRDTDSYFLSALFSGLLDFIWHKIRTSAS